MKVGVFAFLALFAATAWAGPEGRWRTASGNLEVDVAPCGGPLCGTVSRVLSNHSMSEPGAELPKGVPGEGLVILWNFVPTEDGRWSGQIYQRESGESYACVLSLDGPDRLNVHGYVGFEWMGQTQVWERVK